MSLTVALYVLALILAIIAWVPPLRSYPVLHAAVFCIALGLVLSSGAIHP
jgi:hypothetical protein